MPGNRKKQTRGKEDALKGQKFRLGIGPDGRTAWIPLESNTFVGYDVVGDHIEFVGKNREFAQDEDEGEAEMEEEDEVVVEGQFDDADDISLPSVQKGLKSYRNAKRKKESQVVDDLWEFPDDGYDYNKHLKAPGQGFFVPIDVEYFKKEQKRKGIDDAPVVSTHDSDHLKDEDVDAQLYQDAEEDANGELNDDFIVQANGGVLVEDESQIEEHFEAKARKATEKNAVKQVFGDFNDFNDGDFEVEEEWEEEEDEEDEAEIFRRNDLDEAFEKTLNLYDEDEIGEIADTDPQLQGRDDIENYTVLLMEEFPEVVKKKSYRYVAPIPDNNEEPSPIEEFVPADDLKVVERPKEPQWDVESILSTYSNTDNHPKLIAAPRNQKKIKLSNKTGLPLGVLPTKQPQPQPEEPSENKGKPRGEETPEERKERKKQIKEEKKQAREQKKAYKVAFKQEEIRQASVITLQHVARKIVVKY